MGILLITRHGETNWNSQGKIQGHSDIELSRTGVQQARLLAERLRSVAVDAAYCSDLHRASKTAEIALEGRDVPLSRTPLLREYHKGVFEGLTNLQIQAQFPYQYPTYLSKDLDFAPEGGESTRAVSVRVSRIITEIKNHHMDGTVLVVGHGGSLRAAMTSLLSMSLEANWRFFFDNCALTIVECYPDNAVLRLFNDGSHLKRMRPIDDRSNIG